MRAARLWRARAAPPFRRLDDAGRRGRSCVRGGRRRNTGAAVAGDGSADSTSRSIAAGCAGAGATGAGADASDAREGSGGSRARRARRRPDKIDAVAAGTTGAGAVGPPPTTSVVVPSAARSDGDAAVDRRARRHALLPRRLDQLAVLFLRLRFPPRSSQLRRTEPEKAPVGSVEAAYEMASSFDFGLCGGGSSVVLVNHHFLVRAGSIQ